jgi:uncharacterized protein
VTIGLLQIDFLIPGSRSLKEKRRAMNSLKQRLRNRYNCSVAETDFKDMWNKSHLAICVVSDVAAHVDSQLNEIVRYASQDRSVQIMQYETEML